MTRLEKTTLFSSVGLMKLERRVIGGSNLKHFQIYSRLIPPQVAVATAAGKAAPAKR
jgi:hypothetical protein